jgi:FkbM family methyltransferase
MWETERPFKYNDFVYKKINGMKKFTDKKISYLFNEKKIIKKLVKSKKPVVVDIGGNIGQTCLMLKKIFPESIIHTIEPIQSCFLKLKKNTQKLKSIKYYNFALGNENKKKFIFINENNNMSGSSLIPFNFNSNSKKKNYHKKDKLRLIKNTKEIIDMVKSNSFFNKLKKIDYCKIDTQGYEFNILNNLNDKNFSKIKLLKVELMLDDIYLYDSQKNFSKIINLLLNKNLKIFDISNIYKNIKDTRTLWIDCFFVNTKYYPI